ncbi:hypothetical protein D3C84_992710 [compost metagenome]
MPIAIAMVEVMIHTAPAVLMLAAMNVAYSARTSVRRASASVPEAGIAVAVLVTDAGRTSVTAA